VERKKQWEHHHISSMPQMRHPHLLKILKLFKTCSV